MTTNDLAAMAAKHMERLTVLVDQLAMHHIRAQVRVRSLAKANTPKQQLRWMTWKMTREIARLETQLLRIETARANLGISRQPGPNETRGRAA